MLTSAIYPLPTELLLEFGILNAYPPIAQGGDCGLGAILDIELLQNGCHMVLNRLVADAQGLAISLLLRPRTTYCRISISRGLSGTK